jgi:mannose-1-phosphate guanylyltransferase
MLAGDIFKGKCIDIESKNTFVWSGDRLVASIGLENIIIVDTKDALLVCSKDRAQDVKKIVQTLKQNNFKKQV